MSRWWADADQARGNLALVDGDNVAQGVGTTALAYHALVREQLAPLAETTLVDHAQISKAYDEVDLLPVAVALAKATRPEVGEEVCDSYAVMLVQKWHDDAKLATEAAVRMMSAAGVPMPQVVRRASEVAGIPSGAAATFVSKASGLQMAPDTLADTADRVLMTWASMVGQEEATGNEDVVTKAVRRRVRTEDEEFDESQVNRDSEGRFATQQADAMRAERERRVSRIGRVNQVAAAENKRKKSLREMAQRRQELEAATAERAAAKRADAFAGRADAFADRKKATRAQATRAEVTRAEADVTGVGPRPTELQIRHRDWDGPTTDTFYHKQIPFLTAMQARPGLEMSVSDLVGDGENFIKAPGGHPPETSGARKGNVIIDPGVPIYSDLVDSSMGGSGHEVTLHPDLKFRVVAIDPEDANGPTLYLSMMMPEFGKAEDWDPQEHPRAGSGRGGGRFVRVRQASGEQEAEVDLAAVRQERLARINRVSQVRTAEMNDRRRLAARAEATRAQTERADAFGDRAQSQRADAFEGRAKFDRARITRPIQTRGNAATETAGGFLSGDMEMALILEDQVYKLFLPQERELTDLGTIDGAQIRGVPAREPDPARPEEAPGRMTTGKARNIMSTMLELWSPQVVNQYSDREDAEERLDADVRRWGERHGIEGMRPIIVRNRITGTYDTTASIDQRGYALVGDPATMQAFKAGKYAHLAFIPGPWLEDPADFLDQDADETDWGDFADGMPDVEIWQVIDTGQLD